MRALIDILQGILKERLYYIGTLSWMLGYITSVYSLSLRSYDAVAAGLVGLVSLALVAASLICAVAVIQRLRERFVSNDQRSLLSLCMAFIRFYLKALFLLILLAAPMGFVANLLESSPHLTMSLVPLRPSNRAIVYLVLIAAILVVNYGGAGLIVSRGHSRRSIRDSIKAFPWIWKEVALVTFLLLVPALLALPFHLYSWEYPGARILAAGVDFSTLPYQFAVMNASYLLFGKLLRERAPALSQGETRLTESQVIYLPQNKGDNTQAL